MFDDIIELLFAILSKLVDAFYQTRQWESVPLLIFGVGVSVLLLGVVGEMHI